VDSCPLVASRRHGLHSFSVGVYSTSELPPLFPCLSYPNQQPNASSPVGDRSRGFNCVKQYGVRYGRFHLDVGLQHSQEPVCARGIVFESPRKLQRVVKRARGLRNAADSILCATQCSECHDVPICLEDLRCRLHGTFERRCRLGSKPCFTLSLGDLSQHKASNDIRLPQGTVLNGRNDLQGRRERG